MVDWSGLPYTLDAAEWSAPRVLAFLTLSLRLSPKGTECGKPGVIVHFEDQGYSSYGEDSRTSIELSLESSANLTRAGGEDEGALRGY